MQDQFSQFEQRKQDHIDLALMPANQSSELNPFDRFQLRHEALPDLDFSEINISAQRFRKSVRTPFFVSSMTAGHQQAQRINQNLMSACAEKGWAMGVGSQRRELSDKAAAFEWAPLRQQFPEVRLFSNLGIAQLISACLQEIQALTDAL